MHARSALSSSTRVDARRKILDAAFAVIRQKGYSAATVDDLCAAAGVTKGAFFHHFATKEALGVAVADHWSEVTGALFAAAPYHRLPDPQDAAARGRRRVHLPGGHHGAGGLR